MDLAPADYMFKYSPFLDMCVYILGFPWLQITGFLPPCLILGHELGS